MKGRYLLGWKAGDKQKGGAEANISGVPQGSPLFHGFRRDGDDCKLSSVAKPKPDCKQEDLVALTNPVIKCQTKISINKFQLIQRERGAIIFLHRHEEVCKSALRKEPESQQMMPQSQRLSVVVKTPNVRGGFSFQISPPWSRTHCWLPSSEMKQHRERHQR